MTSPIYDCVINKKTTNKPIWFMRQAEDIYQNLEKLEN